MPGTFTWICPMATECAVPGSAAMADVTWVGSAGAGLPAAPAAPGAPPAGNGTAWTLPPPPSAPIASTRIGLAASRFRSVITCSSDQFRPSAKVAAATPTTRAPSIIEARTGWARPADIPSRPGSPTGKRQAESAGAGRHRLAATGRRRGSWPPPG